MILLLPGLEFLALIDLLYLEFLLLLLVFLVLPGVARVWSGDMFDWGQVLGVNSGARARGFRGWASVLDGRSGVDCSTFSGGYCAAVFEGARLACSSDRRLAVIGGSA